MIIFELELKTIGMTADKESAWKAAMASLKDRRGKYRYFTKMKDAELLKDSYEKVGEETGVNVEVNIYTEDVYEPIMQQY